MVHYHLAIITFSYGFWVLDVLRNELLVATLDALETGICIWPFRIPDRVSAHFQQLQKRCDKMEFDEVENVERSSHTILIRHRVPSSNEGYAELGLRACWPYRFISYDDVGHKDLPEIKSWKRRFGSLI